jgi:pyridoxal phosphate-dependent aminotransferase EpsN
MARIHLSAPDIREREKELLMAAVESGWAAPAGPDLEAFEREVAQVCGVNHAVGLSSGTAALHLALHALGVGRGDEVIVSTFTFAASANAVTYVGATPVFIDSDEATWNLDPDLLEEELEARAAAGKLPAAVICVDLYGQPADYRRIEPICERFDVPLIEDAAEALGSSLEGRPAGSFGRVAALSFNGNKVITTSGGGMLVGNDGELIERARFLSTQAKEPAPHYEHHEIGFNYRLSNLLAAFGRGQLEALDQRIARRREIFDQYQQAIGEHPGVTFHPEIPGGVSNRWLSCALIEPERAGVASAQVREQLETADIESRPTWKPMHMQLAFRGRDRLVNGTSERLFDRGICLPSGSATSATEMDRIVEALRSCFPG